MHAAVRCCHASCTCNKGNGTTAVGCGQHTTCTVQWRDAWQAVLHIMSPALHEGSISKVAADYGHLLVARHVFLSCLYLSLGDIRSGSCAAPAGRVWQSRLSTRLLTTGWLFLCAPGSPGTGPGHHNCAQLSMQTLQLSIPVRAAADFLVHSISLFFL